MNKIINNNTFIFLKLEISPSCQCCEEFSFTVLFKEFVLFGGQLNNLNICFFIVTTNIHEKKNPKISCERHAVIQSVK